MGDAEVESVGRAICIVKQLKFVPEFIGGVSGKCYCFFSGPVDFHTGPGEKQKHI